MGQLGQAGRIGYGSSKGAVLAGVKSMAVELAHRRIRVNSLSPRVVETEMTASFFEKIPKDTQDTIMNMHPLGLGTTSDIANVIAFLLSEASRWITGTNIIVDGGYSVM